MRSPNSLGRLWSITTYISKNVGAAQSCLFSLFGLWFVGLSRIDPTNDSWLLPTPNRLDHAVAQLNWEFYRSAPVVQWSPVLIPDLGVGWGTVYVPFSSGSLFGLIFKWFDFILPDTFQFLGLWLLFSFTMLGYWSVRLVRVVADKPSIVWLGSTLLALSPTIFYRIGVLGHFELSAHWLLFAAIWNYFSSDFRGRRWALICVVTLVVNVYLFAMVFAVFLASFVKHLATGLKRRTATLKGVVVVWLTSISFAVFGFLEYRECKGSWFLQIKRVEFSLPKLRARRDCFWFVFSSSGLEWNLSESTVHRVRKGGVQLSRNWSCSRDSSRRGLVRSQFSPYSLVKSSRPSATFDCECRFLLELVIKSDRPRKA